MELGPDEVTIRTVWLGIVVLLSASRISIVNLGGPSALNFVGFLRLGGSKIFT